jgi:hypothetical protein
MNALDREAEALRQKFFGAADAADDVDEIEDWADVRPGTRAGWICIARHVRARERKKFKEGIDYCGRKFAESHQ